MNKNDELRSFITRFPVCKPTIVSLAFHPTQKLIDHHLKMTVKYTVRKANHVQFGSHLYCFLLLTNCYDLPQFYFLRTY